uniref:Ycf46 n=1 Tax=Meringosphaera mediterranea TaxID=2837474 RepID=UPI00286CBB6F|nr:Ycf46 [Meringosphaera mediterranea]WLD05697.1 Ycf46 [Meringosphaera mediterranea]
MSFNKELNLLLKARYPILYITSSEEERVEQHLLLNLKVKQGKIIYNWNFIDGYISNPNISNKAIKNPLQALDLIETLKCEQPTIFLLKDFNKFFSDIAISRKLRNLSRQLKTEPKTIIIVTNNVEIPTDLTDLITVLEFPLPTPSEINIEITRLIENLEVTITPEFLNQILFVCKGLQIEKIRRVLAKSLALYGDLNENTLNLIKLEKQQLIKQTQILEYIRSDTTFKSIGGLNSLKNWITNRKDSFSKEAKMYGLPSPKGVLLTGIQGTGKSMSAKAIANEWKLPLLKLDIGKLFGGIVGESESKVREMIQTSEALAPCILWIDEIDKAFMEQTSSGDSGTTNRVLATFITWLSEKESDVFVVATANNFTKLPFEMIRKGRFDEIFFLDLPTKGERKNIFKVNLQNKRPKNFTNFDLELLSDASEGFSGAEIEQAIIEAMYIAFNQKREFTNDDILEALNLIIPMVELNEEKIENLKTLANAGRIRLAS